MKNKKIVSCRSNCKDWKEAWRKNGTMTICRINRKDLPLQGRHHIPYWCPKISDYYEKKRSKKKK